MNNLSWRNFKKHFISYIPALLILGLGTAMINVILKIEHKINHQINDNVKGIEALVGAKGSPIQLTLANIYHLDDPTGNIPLEKALKLYHNNIIDKALPMAYGDNHKGYKLLGTNLDYIEHYNGKLEKGRHVEKVLEVVVGYNFAKKFSIDVGYTFYSNHGTTGGHVHKENQYVVVGILEKTDNVLDNLLLTSIASLWKAHHQDDLANPFDSLSFIKAKALNKTLVTEHNHAQCTDPSHHHEHDETNEHKHDTHTEEGHDHSHAHVEVTHDEHEEEEVGEKQITALLLKFKGPMGFFLINQINNDPELMAINPSQTVNKFFSVLGAGYSTIQAIGLGVIVIAIITLMLTLIQVFANRKYELALLRTMGASKLKLARSLLLEVFIIVSLGFIVGLGIMYGTLELLPYFVEQAIFEGFDWKQIGLNELIIYSLCLVCGMVSVFLPLLKVYNIDISKTLSNEN